MYELVQLIYKACDHLRNICINNRNLLSDIKYVRIINGNKPLLRELNFPNMNEICQVRTLLGKKERVFMGLTCTFHC